MNNTIILVALIAVAFCAQEVDSSTSVKLACPPDFYLTSDYTVFPKYRSALPYGAFGRQISEIWQL